MCKIAWNPPRLLDVYYGVFQLDVLCKELSHHSFLGLEGPQSPRMRQLELFSCSGESTYLVMSAARRPAEVMTRVWGLPFCLEAEDRDLFPLGLEL